MTKPGADNAAWQNLFANYLPLAGGTVNGSFGVNGTTSLNGAISVAGNLSVGVTCFLDAAHGHSGFYCPSAESGASVVTFYSDIGGPNKVIANINADGSFRIYGGGYF